MRRQGRFLRDGEEEEGKRATATYRILSSMNLISDDDREVQVPEIRNSDPASFVADNH